MREMDSSNSIGGREFMRELEQDVQRSIFHEIISEAGFDPFERLSIGELESLLPRAHQLKGQLELF